MSVKFELHFSSGGWFDICLFPPGYCTPSGGRHSPRISNPFFHHFKFLQPADSEWMILTKNPHCSLDKMGVLVLCAREVSLQVILRPKSY